MLQAKPIIPDRFWIVRDEHKKVGNIESDSGGYVVSVNGSQIRVKTLISLEEKITFEPPVKTAPDICANSVYGFPTPHPPHNAVFDVRHQLPLWTREPNSKSWLAAGWYRIKQHNHWRVSFCPKLILLDRYSYQGPFQTRQEAEQA